MDFGVLGPLNVAGEHGPVTIAGVKERIVLAHLVANVGHLVTTDELIDSLWGESPPRTATKSLQNHVMRVRQALGADRLGATQLIRTEGPGYRLATPPDTVDAHRFTQLAAIGRQALDEDRAEAAAATLRQALALWRGPAYAGFESTKFGRAESRRLEDVRITVVEDRIAADLALGRAHEVTPELQALVDDYPYRERLWFLLVLGLYRSGRQGDAVSAYHRARTVLSDELGIDPGRELQDLYARVLVQDPTLMGPARAVPATLVRGVGPVRGRETELNRLRRAWTRAAAGKPTVVTLRGSPQAGVSRLAAELAATVAARGAVVQHRPDGELELGDVVVPTLTVLEAPGGRASIEVAGPRLVLLLGRPEATVPRGSEVIDVGPLSTAAVREIVADYVPEDQVEDAVSHILRESGGLPGRVHDEAIAWVRRGAASRVGAAAARTGRVREDLATARAELVAGVEALQNVDKRVAPAAPEQCPWPGLAAYDVEDARWFAGRERLVAELVASLAESRVVGVLGASGSGKSSLVRAGLLAALAEGALPGSDTWTRLLLRPGEHPLRELARVVLGAAEATPRQRIGDLLERLVQGEPPSGRTVLVVDQLEEVWTTCADPVERTAFLDALASLADEAASLAMVLVLRADYVPELADLPSLARQLTDASVLVGAPTEAELRRAVERPAELAGLVLDVGLADALVADAGAEPGVLPVLSTALTRLWERRAGQRLTLAAYVGGGGLSGAIARLAEDAYEAMDTAQQAACRLLMLRLAGPGQGEAVTRRRVPLNELVASADRDARTVDHDEEVLPRPLDRTDAAGALDVLVAHRLIIVDSAGQRTTAEVAHEALFRE